MVADGADDGRANGDQREPTHELVCLGDPADEIAADTRVVAAASEFGDEALVTMATEDVSDRSPHTQRLLDDSMERVPDGSDLAADGPTWRATLPGDADALRRALTVDAADSEWTRLGEARWRVWDVQRVEVRREGEWIYRSIPHHSRFELAAEGVPDLVERVSERLVDLPCVAVSAGPLARWDGGGELTHRTLRFEPGSGVSLRHVRRVAVDRDRRELVVDWEPVGERVATEPSLFLRGILRAFAWTAERLDASDGPPRRAALDADEFDAVADGLATVRERVGYDYEIVEI